MHAKRSCKGWCAKGGDDAAYLAFVTVGGTATPEGSLWRHGGAVSCCGPGSLRPTLKVSVPLGGLRGRESQALMPFVGGFVDPGYSFFGITNMMKCILAFF